MKLNTLMSVAVFLAAFSSGQAGEKSEPLSFSGIYPHLSYYNNEGECGTGAVVPWGGKLWVITYGPHLPNGSSDKLYEISSDLQMSTRDESIGGTPANRLIHKESNQLFIGPYAIDGEGKVRVIPWQEMPGRLTGGARHLTAPEAKVYVATMEEGFYEVDVDTLKVDTLYVDHNKSLSKDQKDAGLTMASLPGWHGKGLYSGQGVMVFSNNGETGSKATKQFDIESGVLAEWDGKDWKTIRRNQFTEITGPGGISGNGNPATDPIWATGWDHRSLLLGLRDKGGWKFFRMPKASNTYDGAHGWNTEWPRIRDVGTADSPRYLMTMHGMFWDFPKTFSSGNTAGIRPLSTYLKVIGDFTRWNDRLVFGCDDTAEKEFLNARKIKGKLKGPGQSHSNLWFTSLDAPAEWGTNTACGAVWLNDSVSQGQASEPFLFAGWDKKAAWVGNHSGEAVTLDFEADAKGDNAWKSVKKVTVPANSSAFVPFDPKESGEWIRVIPDRSATMTVDFVYRGEEKRGTEPAAQFKGLSKVSDQKSAGGLLYARGKNLRTMGILAGQLDGDRFQENGFYELDGQMKLVKKEGADGPAAKYAKESYGIEPGMLIVDEASILITDDAGRRWRLPKGDKAYEGLTDSGVLRLCREVATERDLFSALGTFYELPAENADGFAKIRPIASHPFRVHDYASFRGMLILTGLDSVAAQGNPHVITSDDGKAMVWAGAIDDLWKLGKPTGHGGPWKNSDIKAGKSSDPYLIGFYDKRTLELSHDSKTPVTFKIEVNPIGHGPWMLYKEVTVAPGETFKYKFPDNFEVRWIRFTGDRDAKATAHLEYK